METSIYVSHKVLNTSIHKCAAAWKAFDASDGYYEHPGSGLVVIRLESGVVFMSSDEDADGDIRFQKFDEDRFRVYLRLVAAAAAQNQKNMNAIRTMPERTRTSVVEAGDV